MAESELAGDDRSRRDFLRKSLLAGGVAASAPLIASFNVPAGAQVGSAPLTRSLSFTIPAYANANSDTKTANAPDPTSAVIVGDIACVLAGYTAGQVPAYSGSASGTRLKNGPETGSVTIGGLPSTGTCAVTVLARCGPDATPGSCTTGTATKPNGSTSVTVSGLTASCAGDTGFRKYYVTVTC